MSGAGTNLGPWAAALAIAMLSMVPRAAVCAAAPDSLALARLSAAAMEHNRFRVVTDKGPFLVTSLRVDAEGVVVQVPPARPAVIVGSRPDETRRASWSEVERIEGMRSHSLPGAMVGGLVGGIVGLGAMQMSQGGLHDAGGVAILAIPIGVVLGGVVGAVVGSTSGWEPLYP